MARPTHFRDRDHEGFDFAANIIVSEEYAGPSYHWAGEGLEAVLADIDERLVILESLL